MTVKAMSKFCDRAFGCDSNFHFQPLFDCRYVILFLSFTVLTLKFCTLYTSIVVMMGRINYFSRKEQVRLFHITLYSSSLRKYYSGRKTSSVFYTLFASAFAWY